MYSAPMHLKDCASPLKTETWDRMFAPLRGDKDLWWKHLKEMELIVKAGVDGELHRLLENELEYWMYRWDRYAY